MALLIASFLLIFFLSWNSEAVLSKKVATAEEPVSFEVEEINQESEQIDLEEQEEAPRYQEQNQEQECDQVETPSEITEEPIIPEENNIDEKKVYLTFDDGPTPFTEQLLNVLNNYKVQATFFMLEPRMNEFQESLLRMVEEGHALGLHGVSHRLKQFYRSSESVLNEMNTGQATLENITGIKTFLIRTPYGSHPHMKPEYKTAVKDAGYKLWDWNVDSRDWHFRDERLVEYTIAQIKALEKANKTPVILLHDREETIKHLPQILDYLVNNNYTFKVITPDIPNLTF